eukprot:1179768-Prorocentrum_minimum.AAC.1
MQAAISAWDVHQRVVTPPRGQSAPASGPPHRVHQLPRGRYKVAAPKSSGLKGYSNLPELLYTTTLAN